MNVTVAERLRALSPARRERLEPVLGALVEELIATPEARLAALAPHLVDPDEEVAELERRNLLRLLDLWRELEAASLDGERLAEALGVGRESLRQMRADGRLLGFRVPGRRSFRYPRWQFDRRGRLRADLRELLGAGRDGGLEPLDVHLVLTSRAAGEDGRAPLEDLETPAGRRRAVDLLAAGAEGW